MISLSTLFGAIAGIGIVSWGVLSATKDWQIFISIPSASIVFGGTLTSAFIGYRWRYIQNSLFSILRVFVRQKITPRTLAEDVGLIIGWSKRVQKEGSVAFEKIGKESKSDYLDFVTALITTGYSQEEIRFFAETNIEENYFRHLNESNILSTMASASPAFGMVGTLIGLIVMLSKMDDPSQMGPGLSIALMTTLYGVLIARFIFQPCSTKVKQLLGIQRFREYLLLEGIMLILEKRSPFYIQDRLNSYLDRKRQYTIQKSGDSKK
ncbi:MAG: MotA/TolQ/ExbB proton channel family protein [Fibrobacteria bacterium]|nr:MotA/TolQ/ExbB proton channel family protein [Fibrobacteria bacterium]